MLSDSWLRVFLESFCEGQKARDCHRNLQSPIHFANQNAVIGIVPWLGLLQLIARWCDRCELSPCLCSAYIRRSAWCMQRETHRDSLELLRIVAARDRRDMR